MNRFALLFLAFAVSLFGKEKTDILFYLQDAGETYALLPVIRKLEEKAIDYRVLVAGVAEEAEKTCGLPASRFKHFRDYKVETAIDKNWARSQKLSEAELNLICEEIEPREVVTGVAFALQGQILEKFAKANIPTFAYWDNFNTEGDNPYFQTAREVEKWAETLLLPVFGMEKAFETRKTAVVGQPTLQQWKEEVQAMDIASLRARAGVAPDRKIALFIGGYGREFDEAFALFLKGISLTEGVDFLIQPHPKTKGREFIFPSPNCKMLNGELSTVEAVGLADVVICHQSTVAFQALAVGKPVLHTIPLDQRFDSLPLQKGLAKKISCAEDFSDAIRSAMQTPVIGFFDLLQIPDDSTAIFVSTLLERL